jgi:hypothetical protein
MKKNFVKALALLVFAGFVSCNDDDPAPEGVADVYIISKQAINEETQAPEIVYGLHIDAVGYYGTLSAVKAVVGTTTINLEKDNDTGTFFYEQEEYTTEKPQTGTYTMTYTFSTQLTAQSADALTSETLDPAVITQATYGSEKIELSWEEVDDAEACYVQMKDSDGDIVFRTSNYLPGDETDYDIVRSSGTWDSSHTMTNGATYTVEVVALLGSSSGSLQAMSIGTKTVVWGQAD